MTRSNDRRRVGARWSLAATVGVVASLVVAVTVAVPAAAHPEFLTVDVAPASAAPGEQATIAISGTVDANYPDAHVLIDKTGMGSISDVASIVDCTGTSRTCFSEGPEIWVPVGDLSVDQEIDAQLIIEIEPDAEPEAFVLTSQFYSAGSFFDEHDGPAFSITGGEADVGLALTAGPAGLLTSTINYGLEVTNDGADPLEQATVETTFSGAVSNVTSPDGCSFAAGVVSCPIGAVAASASTTVEFSAQIGLLTLGPFTATASRVSSTPEDPNPANDTDTATCTAVTSLVVIC